MNPNYIARLEKIISHLDELYYQGEPCVHPETNEIVTDGEYDAFRRQLKNLKPNSWVFDAQTAAKGQDNYKKVSHDPPMTSIEKASHEDLATKEGMLVKWINDLLGESPKEVLLRDRFDVGNFSYPKNWLYQAYKYDGVACGIYYENGILVKAGLRPRKGRDGEDVTEQVKYVAGVPQKLPLPLTCSIRGEIICKKSDFEKVQKEMQAMGEPLRANPRNHAAGAIRNFKDPSKVAKMRLSFIGYGIENLNNPPYKTEIERAKWSNKVLGVPFTQIREFNCNDLVKMEANAPTLDYEVDGIIIGVDNLEEQEQYGRHGGQATGNPKGKIAWKFAEEVATPVINEIIWHTGRTGKIVPVALFDAVPLAGTMVSRATMHNAGFILRNRIVIGTKIQVLKAGKIIPKVVGIVSGQCSEKKKLHDSLPHVCPTCKCQTNLVQGGQDDNGNDMYELRCENDNCSAKQTTRFVHFLKTLGILGVGESSIDLLLESGKIKNFLDILTLNAKEIVESGFSERESLLIAAAVQMIPAPSDLDNDQLYKKLKKRNIPKIPLYRLLSALGIANVGEGTSQRIVNHFKTLDAILAASAADFAAVDDVGDKTAENFYEYISENKQLVKALADCFELELPKVGKLTGTVICLSGTLDEGKDYWKKRIHDKGGQTTDSVGRKVNYLVAGPGSVSKTEKAKTLGIPILTEQELATMVG